MCELCMCVKFVCMCWMWCECVSYVCEVSVRSYVWIHETICGSLKIVLDP